MDKIDFVILWVDGNDQTWLNEKNKYSKAKVDSDEKKYRDYDILKYWFRAVEKYTPWVNKIHFVTYGHLPRWLNLSNPKLNVVKHEDFIPKEYLPTFNSHTIELNIHRIKGLVNKFVYFNDDMFVIKDLTPEYFFKNDLPCDIWEEDILVLDKTSDLNFAHILVNDLKVINKNFDKHKCIKENFFKWFNFKYGKGVFKNILLGFWGNIAGFYNYHMPNAYLKETFIKVWFKERQIMHNSCLTKFRDDNDVNQYVMSLWQIYSGQFTPKSHKKFGRIFTLSDNNTKLYKFLKNPDRPMVCINDGNVQNFDKVKNELCTLFEQKFPKKSSFEK